VIVAQKLVSPVEAVRFDGLRVVRLTVLSFVFVALLSASGGDSQPSSPAATSDATNSHSRTLISEQ